MLDYIMNGQAQGDVATRLLDSDFDPNVLRPYKGPDGRAYITVNGDDGKPKAIPINNANATLRKDEWQLLDKAVVKAAKPRLRAIADLRARGLDFVIPNGMGKTVLQTQSQSDITGAEITMDGLEKGKGDRPHYDLTNMPLPIIHKDFSFPTRQIQTSRSGGSPLDTSMVELASRQVAQSAEQLLLGTLTTFTFGGGTLYGYTNFPDRLTTTIISPAVSAWVPATAVTNVLTMVQASIAAFHFGPWMLYFGPSWSPYMNDEYKAQSDKTLAQRLKGIDSIVDVRMLDYLTGYDLILVQLTPDVVREVIGMDITTIQWETSGGMEVHFKVMAIMCPQLRSDFNGNTGIVHGSV